MYTTALTTFFERVKARFELPLNKGNHLLGQRDGKLHPVPSVVEIGIIESDTELEIQKGAGESFGTVFNQWLRIARASGKVADDWSNGAIPSELDEWTYSDVNNSITCTVNSASLVGFISPSYFDQYTLEAKLTSGSADDDYIGFCIAFATDDQGRDHTLTVTRQLNGPAPMSIIKDWKVSEYVVEHVFDGLKWQDGTVASGSLGGTNDQGWNKIPNGIRLKVTRDGDIITIETSQANESAYFEPAKTVIDLSADPELEVFRGPQRWGYVCHSQPGSTWEVLERPGESGVIFDRRNGDLWQINGSTWLSSPYSVQEAIDDGVMVENWMHFNTITGKCYYVQPGPVLTRL